MNLFQNKFSQNLLHNKNYMIYILKTHAEIELLLIKSTHRYIGRKKTRTFQRNHRGLPDGKNFPSPPLAPDCKMVYRLAGRQGFIIDIKMGVSHKDEEW